MADDVNAAFTAKIALRAEERERRAEKLPQHYESLEDYHEDHHLRRPPPPAEACVGFAQLKRRR